MFAKHVQVLVRRDMAEIIGTAVFEHEVEILRDMHGDGNVTVDESIEYPAIEIDAGEEFDRLMNVYGRNEDGQPYVERCIGRGPKQLEALGIKKRGRPAKEEDEA
jgi:hypothetical protein